MFGRTSKHALGGAARILGISVLGQEPGAHDLKSYGYGVPMKVDYELSGQCRTAVLETVTPGPFGHEHMADRAQILLWSHTAYNQLPRHVHSLDVGGFSKDGALVSLGSVEEFFILNDFVPGDGYYQDLERLRDGVRPSHWAMGGEMRSGHSSMPSGIAARSAGRSEEASSHRFASHPVVSRAWPACFGRLRATTSTSRRSTTPSRRSASRLRRR
jgi:hypothetical protein